MIPNHHNRVLWGCYMCMMLLTNHLSTVSFFYLIMNDTLLTNLFISPNIRNWNRNIEQYASDNVNKILVGNKADMDENKRVVPTAKGQALADEYGIKFFEIVSTFF
uniref:Uncharacterized protein n=1 Tax=Lactuca sativa TaxID=4236 RepID=A0A9R1V8U0_LACSA|nr:hypothetical protein LSAT_V11C500259350 [Lactuca sativa]